MLNTLLHTLSVFIVKGTNENNKFLKYRDNINKPHKICTCTCC